MTDASPITPYLPKEEGLLPRWLLLVSTVSLIWAIQTFVSLAGAREIYTAPTTIITGLSSRTFGTWSTLSTVVRLYAVYNIHNKVAYELCMWTWLIALVHFASEWLIFGTAKMGRGLASPILVAGSTGIWMWLAYGEYIS